MEASDEDEHLRKDGDLEVDNGMQLLIIVFDLTRRGIQMDIELALEEVQLEDDNNKDDSIQAIRTWSRTRSSKRGLREEHQIETIAKISARSLLSGYDNGNTQSTESVIIVPSLRSAMIRTRPLWEQCTDLSIIQACSGTLALMINLTASSHISSQCNTIRTKP